MCQVLCQMFCLVKLPNALEIWCKMLYLFSVYPLTHPCIHLYTIQLPIHEFNHPLTYLSSKHLLSKYWLPDGTMNGQKLDWNPTVPVGCDHLTPADFSRNLPKDPSFQPHLPPRELEIKTHSLIPS